MIIGNGLIATAFKNNDAENIIFFASGVSNSLETNPNSFLREENLILETIHNHPHKSFIYFSSCSIYDSSKKDSQYVAHKLKMEQLIKNKCINYLLLRVSNAVGKGGNPNTLLNYLTDAIKNQKLLNIHTKATRNIIDVEDIKNITLDLVQKNISNTIINLAYPYNYYVTEIVAEIEAFYRIKAVKNYQETGIDYSIEVDTNFVKFEEYQKIQYLKKILNKYYKE